MINYMEGYYYVESQSYADMNESVSMRWVYFLVILVKLF